MPVRIATTMGLLAWLPCACLFAGPPTLPSKPGPLTVFPAMVTLDGPRATQRLIVTTQPEVGMAKDATRRVAYRSLAPEIAAVDTNGIVHAKHDGQAAIAITLGSQQLQVPVTVAHAAGDRPVDFSREIVPILTKAGCNQGACHGSQHGKGGFWLSLLGYDPPFDYTQIVQSAEGRRVVVSEPERSILLLKPTLAMEHGGGERLSPQSAEYFRLRQWLEDGAPEPRPDDPVASRLEVFPPRRVLAPGEQQQIAVRVTWSDGRIDDVTNVAQFDALNESIASVSPTGLVTTHAAGETHIMIRFCGQATVFQVTSPYPTQSRVPAFEALNFIDQKLAAKWRELGLAPSSLCSDEEFLRRVHLDTLGLVPTPAEVRAFLADRRPDKRRIAIDRVLERPEFVDFWALKWGDLLRISRDQLTDKGMWSFHNWIRAALRDNRPVDAFVRDIITAEGSTFTEGPANFYRTGNSPEDWAENTAQLFLGVRMQCARCHHHPFEKWSQDDYYGLSAFFVRLGTKGSQEFGIFGGERVIYLRDSGEQYQPRKGTLVKPHPLDGPPMDDPFDRRQKLAEWVTSPNNPFFARNIVNRFWGYYMGRGLVEPLDDLRGTNPASNPELLDALAADFAQAHFDLKHLLRQIMRSHAYQLSSTPVPANAVDVNNTYFARYSVKRLTAEQLADALDAITENREKYQGVPLGTRAAQLPDTTVRSFLLDVFGRPPRQVTCECERTTQPNIAQALHLLNGDALNRKINAPGGRIDRLLKAQAAPAAIVEELYLAAIGRLPGPEEAVRAQSWMAKASSPREGAQDLLWALLNSREFLFNH